MSSPRLAEDALLLRWGEHGRGSVTFMSSPRLTEDALLLRWGEHGRGSWSETRKPCCDLAEALVAYLCSGNHVTFLSSPRLTEEALVATFVGLFSCAGGEHGRGGWSDP